MNAANNTQTINRFKSKANYSLGDTVALEGRFVNIKNKKRIESNPFVYEYEYTESPVQPKTERIF